MSCGNYSPKAGSLRPPPDKDHEGQGFLDLALWVKNALQTGKSMWSQTSARNRKAVLPVCGQKAKRIPSCFLSL